MHHWLPSTLEEFLHLPSTAGEWLMFLFYIIAVVGLILLSIKFKTVETANVQIIKVKEEAIVTQGQAHIKRSYKVDYNGLNTNYIVINPHASEEQKKEYQQLNEGDWIEISVIKFRFPIKSIKMEFVKKI